MATGFTVWMVLGWLALGGFALYVLALGAVVDVLSPFPTYRHCFRAIQRGLNRDEQRELLIAAQSVESQYSDEQRCPRRLSGFSLLERLMWLPLLTAPISKTGPKVLVVTLVCAGLTGVLGGKQAIGKGVLVGWILGCWFASLTYKQDTQQER